MESNQMLNIICSNSIIISTLLSHLEYEEDLFSLYDAFPLLRKYLIKAEFYYPYRIGKKIFDKFLGCYGFEPDIDEDYDIANLLKRDCNIEFLDDPMRLIKALLKLNEVPKFNIEFPDCCASFVNNCLYLEIFGNDNVRSKLISLASVVRSIIRSKLKIRSNLSSIPIEIMELFDEISIIPDYTKKHEIDIKKILYDHPKVKEINFGSCNVDTLLDNIDNLYHCFKECEKRGIEITDCPSKHQGSASYFNGLSSRYKYYKVGSGTKIFIEITGRENEWNPEFRVIGEYYGEVNKNITKYLLHGLDAMKTYVFSMMRFSYKFKPLITL